MSAPLTHRLFRPETLTALGIIVAAGIMAIPTISLDPISALLPVVTLAALLVLSLVLLAVDQRRASVGEAAAAMTHAPRRVGGAFLLIVLFAVATDFVGFYPCVAISVPGVAACFGYRRPVGLALATMIVLASIWLVFSYGMSQGFPAGRLWQM